MAGNDEKLNDLIAEAQASGGAERANYQPFVTRLCAALGLPEPTMAKEENERNDYVFDRRIDFKHPDGSRMPGWLDCYKRGAFMDDLRDKMRYLQHG